MIRKLNWDSDFFGISIAEVRYDAQSAIGDVADFDLLFVKNDVDYDLQLPGFKKGFSETKVIFTKDLDPIAALSQGNIVPFDEQKHNREEIYELAYESGQFSRFKLDNNFKKGKFEELYNKWVDNAINKTFADELLIFSKNGQSMGFVTYKINQETATIGLIGVGPDFQRKGIGQQLLKHVEDKLFKKGIQQLLIPTQLQNQQACNFYEKQGYQIKEKTYIKHYWKNDTI